MDLEELERIIAGYKITKSRCRGSNNISLPFMLTTFRNLIKDEVPPKQDEFIDCFKASYPNLNVAGLLSRLKKAYLSYIREYHLGYLLNKSFKKVIYDEEVDLKGVDYVIYYKGYKFNIHAFVDTDNGRYWRGIKNNRHKFRGTHLDVPMDLDKGKKCGEFILYTEDDIKKLKSAMDQIVNSKKYFQKVKRKKGSSGKAA